MLLFPVEANRSKTNSNKRKLPNSVFSDDYTTSSSFSQLDALTNYLNGLCNCLANASKKSKKLHELYKDPVDITFKGTFDQVN